MVVRMMRWRSSSSSKKFEAKIVIRRVQGITVKNCDFERLFMEIKWKGSNKANALRSLRKSFRRNLTKEAYLLVNGCIQWNEEFTTVCNFSAQKDGLFHPWEAEFTLFNGFNQGQKDKAPVVGTASLNFAEFASEAEGKEIEFTIPLKMPSGGLDCSPSLCISLSLSELTTSQEPSETETLQRSPISPRSGEVLSVEKNELSAFKAGLRKVKIFNKLSSRRVKKEGREGEISDGRNSVRGEDIEYNYPFDTDSLDDGTDEVETEDDSSVQKIDYRTLAHANLAGVFYLSTSGSEDEELIYYSKPISSDASLNALAGDKPLRQNSKQSIFPWRKRKMSFRSPKDKGEPLLKKYLGEEGGDDIDFDRRQLSSSDESTFERKTSISEFGDDSFAVGSWEQKEVISRDGHMKLQTQVFFASIDQRSERAAGESACTALVAVIANWFQNNRDEMPIKSELDSLIREGSLEWRKLCGNEAYMARFPDKHFDLDTILEAKICPSVVVPEKSFIGFFHPEGLEKGGFEGFEFLSDAMSFDNIWDEISQVGSNNSSNGNPLVYIVSWNDHFFVLKVENDAYYIIDTLGERLYEGCNQAYLLKFDKDTTIRKIQNETPPSNEKHKTKTSGEKVEPSLAKVEMTVKVDELKKQEDEELVVCSGKESCKEYIKSFLAAIPIRELQNDLKRGSSSIPLHHRLQIELHYTHSLQPVVEFFPVEAIVDTSPITV